MRGGVRRSRPNKEEEEEEKRTITNRALWNGAAAKNDRKEDVTTTTNIRMRSNGLAFDFESNRPLFDHCVVDKNNSHFVS